MTLVLRLVLTFGAMGLLFAAGSGAKADPDETTYCFERPITFDPLFRPSGCFTYKPVDGGMVMIGRALVDAGFASRGSTVEARIAGNECGITTVDGAEGLFILGVAAAASQEGCGGAGKRVEFLINGASARQSLLWHVDQGENPELFSLTALTSTFWLWFERRTTPPPRVGVPVEAFMGGVLCGQATIGGESDALGGRPRVGMRGFLRLAIVRSGGVCGQEGESVGFRVGGLRAETVVRWAANVQRLDLVVQGDANCDLLVDPRDATVVMQYAAGLADSLPCHGDADHSGEVNVIDAQYILQVSAGLSVALPE